MYQKNMECLPSENSRSGYAVWQTADKLSFRKDIIL